jgi:hypothetical protein
MADTGQFTGATMTEASLNRDFSAVMQSSAEKFESVVRELRTEVGDRLLPELVKLIPVLQQAVPELQRFLDGVIKVAQWATEHPFAGFAAAITLAITSELAKAAIGEVVKRAITAAITGGGAGGGGAGGGGGVIPKVFSALPAPVTVGVGLGIATGVVIGNSMLKYETGTENAQDLQAKVEAWKRGNHTSGVSPESAQAQIDAANRRLDHGSILGHTADLLQSPVFDSSSNSYKQYKADQGLVDNEALAKTIADAMQTEKLTSAIERNTKALNASSGSGGTDPGKDPKRDTNLVKRN